MARYAADYSLPHQLYGCVKYADYPHAEILNIDISEALKINGVEAVLTYKDVPGENRFGLIPNIRILADDRTRYLGDAVALIAARTIEIAKQAARHISIKYHKLPDVIDPRESLKEETIKIHEEGNLVVHHKVLKGDIARGFKQSVHVIEQDFSTPAIEHAYLEPEAALAYPDEQDGIAVIGCLQNIYTSHKVIAAALNLPLAKVKIIQSTMGGSFGGKDEASTLVAARAALLAVKTKRPVKIVNSREDSMIQSYKRHPYYLNYRWGCDQDGRLLAMQHDIIADSGAYCSMTPFVTWRSVVQAAGPYRCPNVKTDVRGVYTNNNYTGAMRGFGSPQVNVAIEIMMDKIAEKTNKSPLEIRLLNGFGDGAVTATGQKLSHDVSLKQVLTIAAEKSDFENKWRQNRSKENQSAPVSKGIGLSCSYRGVSLGAEGVDAASAVVHVQPDGSINVSSGIIDMGQGAQTALAQIAAEVLGVSMKRMRFLEPDTTRVADSGPTVASRGTIMGGGAVKIAAEKVAELIKEILAEKHKIRKESLLLKNEKIETKSGKRVCTFTDAVKLCYAKGTPLFANGVRYIAETDWNEKTGRGNAYFTYVYGANVAEVEVDRETGKVNVTRFISVHDVGKAINKSMVEGQIYGGIAMGTGYAIMESFIQESGMAKTINFDEYYIPTALDVPQMESFIVENPDKHGPFGAKSIGEPALEIVAPTIINAIFNATGKHIYNLPASLEEVLLGKKLRRDVERGSLSCKPEV
ncbi:MAG: xanthine dehydrogenase family protein [Calditrichaceae bacterium]|nr:xanthine dehydrogenase family protein [Calditrichaceae bacterium]MBN2708496.1 xanthine dehydrogenase family protein [Calditrichaceae bacterium]RQV91966.1 MAG: xanthine dehydrogenase [Calditrichota bacterium]